MGNTGSYNFIDTDLDHQNNRYLCQIISFNERNLYYIYIYIYIYIYKHINLYIKRMTKAKCS
jgi:hypothetical protein